MEGSEVGGGKLFQRLCHNEVSVRDQSFETLQNYIIKKGISESDMRKIWKALFYCYWMSDKPKVQEEFSLRISSVIFKCSESKAISYLTEFINCMIREWGGIDEFRQNKFSNLLAHFIQASLIYAHTNVKKIPNIYSSIIKVYEHALLDAMKSKGYGLALNFSYIYVGCMHKSLVTDSDWNALPSPISLSQSACSALLKPIYMLLSCSDRIFSDQGIACFTKLRFAVVYPGAVFEGNIMTNNFYNFRSSFVKHFSKLYEEYKTELKEKHAFKSNIAATIDGFFAEMNEYSSSGTISQRVKAPAPRSDDVYVPSVPLQLKKQKIQPKTVSRIIENPLVLDLNNPLAAAETLKKKTLEKLHKLKATKEITQDDSKVPTKKKTTINKSKISKNISKISKSAKKPLKK